MGIGPKVLPALCAVGPHLEPWLWVSQGMPLFIAGLLNWVLDLFGSSPYKQPGLEDGRMVPLCSQVTFTIRR